MASTFSTTDFQQNVYITGKVTNLDVFHNSALFLSQLQSRVRSGTITVSDMSLWISSFLPSYNIVSPHILRRGMPHIAVHTHSNFLTFF